MPADRTRDEAGRYAEEVSDREILAVFAAADDPFLAAGEVADALDVTRRAANYRLERLHEEGLVARKEVGARAVGWWATATPDDASNDRSE